jgi:hypothetical protein
MAVDSTIAVDESGRDGTNLVRGGAFILGSTSLSDTESAQLLGTILGPPPQTAQEWKWSSAARRPAQVLELLESIPLEKVVSIPIHHRFFGWCKAVDSLLYEYPVVVMDEPADDKRQMQVVFLAQSSWEAVRDELDPFLTAWIEAVRHPNETSVENVRREVSRVLRSVTHLPASQTVRLMSEVLNRLTPSQLRQVMLDRDHIDPHVPAVGALIEAWHRRLSQHGSSRIKILHDAISHGDTVDRWTPHFERLGVTVTRAHSHQHPALQIADLVAGATRSAFRDPTPSSAHRYSLDTSLLVRRWLPDDLVIWPWRDPRSKLRSDGVTGARADFDR